MSAPLWEDNELRLYVLTCSRVRGVHRAEEYRAFLERALADAKRRAQLAPCNAQAYSARVQEGIRKALGDPPAGEVTSAAWKAWKRKMPKIVVGRIERDHEAFGLARAPGPKAVRAVIRMIEAAQCEKRAE